MIRFSLFLYVCLLVPSMEADSFDDLRINSAFMSDDDDMPWNAVREEDNVTHANVTQEEDLRETNKTQTEDDVRQMNLTQVNDNATQTNVTQVNDDITQTNVTHVDNDVTQTNVTQMKNNDTQMNETQVDDDVTQTNVTQVVDDVTKTNRTQVEHNVTQTNVTQEEDDVTPWRMTAEENDAYLDMVARTDEKWIQWKQYYGKQYQGMSRVYHMVVFMKNIEVMMQHNALYPASASFYTGLNQFSDLRTEEFLARKKLNRRQSSSLVHVPTDYWEQGLEDMPPTVDWRMEGFDTPVQDEGDCESSWAFSVVGAIEAQHFRQTGQLVDLSEQQILDCSQVYGTSGCNGGSINAAFYYAILNPGGLAAEHDYRYNATVNPRCRRLREEKYIASVRGFSNVGAWNETALKYAVATVGPVAAVIDVTPSTFRQYGGGVYSDRACSSRRVNHGVLIVGYGTYQGQDYWLIKNSWGRDWGINGYMMLARNANNMCGITNMAAFPVA